MPRRKPDIKIESYGRYSKWERESKKLPSILEFTTTIEAIEGNEFGMIIRITGGKGLKLDYCIKHPSFPNTKGDIEPDFCGEYFVNSNDFRFYIGDCIWLPVEDKRGDWEIFIYHDERCVAEKSFKIVSPKHID